MNQRKKTISTLFWVRKSRANGGKAPLFCRVTICGQRYEMPLNLAIDPKLWNAKLQLCTGKTPAAKDINRIIREQTDVVTSQQEATNCVPLHSKATRPHEDIWQLSSC